MDKLKTIIKSSPFIIALIYVLAGVLWIQYSDQIVLSMFRESEGITRAQSLKGWFFVLASGVLIYLLVYQSNTFIDKLISKVQENRDMFEATFEYAPLGIAHHKPNEQWILVNRYLSNLLGYSKNELLNLNFEDFIHPDDLEAGRQLDTDLIHGKISRIKTEKRYRRKDGTYFRGRLTKSAVYDKNSKPLYLIAMVEDITHQVESKEKLEKSLNEKELLLSEVHHRVKNNLALMSAFLELQLMYTKSREVVEILEHYKARLQTLSMIHEKFSKNEQEETIDFKWFLQKQIEYNSQNSNREINYRVNIDEIDLNINQAIPVGLICNELLINANNQNFDSSGPPFIDISLQKNCDSVSINFQNNGTLTNTQSDLGNPDSLDSRIIQSLVNQIEGDFSFERYDKFQFYELHFEKKTWRGAGSSMKTNASKR